MADKVTKEIGTSDSTNVYVPVASTDTSTPGVASFNPDDFAVSSDGQVSSLQKVGAIQYLGESVSEYNEGVLLITLSSYSAKPIQDAQVGDLVMLMEDTETEAHGGLLAGYVFRITSVYNVSKGQVLCSAKPLFNLRGPDSSSLYTVNVDSVTEEVTKTETVRTEQLFNIDWYDYSNRTNINITPVNNSTAVNTTSTVGTWSGQYSFVFSNYDEDGNAIFEPGGQYTLSVITSNLDVTLLANAIADGVGHIRVNMAFSTNDTIKSGDVKYSTLHFITLDAWATFNGSSSFIVAPSSSTLNKSYYDIYYQMNLKQGSASTTYGANPVYATWTIDDETGSYYPGKSEINSFWLSVQLYEGTSSYYTGDYAQELVEDIMNQIVITKGTTIASSYIPYTEEVTYTETVTTVGVVDYELNEIFTEVINKAVSDAVSDATDLTNYYNKTEVDSLLENCVSESDIVEAVNKSNPWYGKTIWWCGTSIPAGNDDALNSYGNGVTYPAYCASLLGATCINVSIGSSLLRVHTRNGDYVQFPASNSLRSMTATKEEKQELMDNWADYEDVMYSWNAASSMWSNETTVLNYSFENILLPYLDGTKDMPDLFVIDHGHNDYFTYFTDSSGNRDTALEPTTANINSGELAEDTYMTDNNYEMLKHYFFNDSDDELAYMQAIGTTRFNNFVASINRNCFLGALNFIITLIYKYNPRATIVLISNYSEESRQAVTDAQQYAASSWDIPLVKVYEKTGWNTNHYIPGTHNYWDTVTDGANPDSSATGTGTKDVTARDVFFYDGTHPHTDKLHDAIPLYAKIIAEYLKTVPKRSDT